jgi:hypothetical protein
MQTSLLILLLQEGWNDCDQKDQTGMAKHRTDKYPALGGRRRQNDCARPLNACSEKDKSMKKKVGLWLDRNKAVIVSIANNVEARSIITSDMEHYVLYSTVVPGDGSPEETRDKRFWNHLGEYYDKIMAHLRDAAEIQIFGPEVAKYELQKHLEDEGLAGNIVSLEEDGKLTDLQIAIKVQKRFPLRSRFDLSSS